MSTLLHLLQLSLFGKDVGDWFQSMRAMENSFELVWWNSWLSPGASSLSLVLWTLIKIYNWRQSYFLVRSSPTNSTVGRGSCLIVRPCTRVVQASTRSDSEWPPEWSSTFPKSPILYPAFFKSLVQFPSFSASPRKLFQLCVLWICRPENNEDRDGTQRGEEQ